MGLRIGSGEGSREIDEGVEDSVEAEVWDVWDEAARRTDETLTVPSIGTMIFNGQSLCDFVSRLLEEQQEKEICQYGGVILNTK